jgi:2-dehydro-3-deoxy-L-rhamnonate dehydrogenase (NAD+)
MNSLCKQEWKFSCLKCRHARNFREPDSHLTGGARGLGRAISQLLASSGADVWIWDVDPIELPGTRSIAFDVTKREEITTALGLMRGELIDILVNDAGYLGPYRAFEEFDPAEWQRIVQANLIGMMEVTHQVLPLMR